VTDPRVRAALPEEAAEIAGLLRRSIIELCVADHGNRPETLAAWLENKTPEAVQGWLATPGQRLIVAELDGRLAGVAAARADGSILLNYVSPDFTRRGVGSVLLADLEAWARTRGATKARLESTTTARAFYNARGYREIGPPTHRQGGGFPMTKPLHARTELVIFDCDGVLVDSEPIALRLLRGTLAAAGVVLTEAEADDLFLGRSLATTREIVARDYGFSVTDAALDDMRRELYAAFRAELRPIAGVAETLDALPCGYCVASSSQPERIRLSLEVTGLWPRFEGRAFSSTMVARGKPFPDLFLHAARSLGYAPAACLVVEDSPAGIRAAQAAGMRVVAFTGGSHAARKEHRDRVAALAPDAVIDDIRELVRLCRGDA
jgi:HAD superfamily hydrolase (TIGR01509 family)